MAEVVVGSRVDEPATVIFVFIGVGGRVSLVTNHKSEGAPFVSAWCTLAVGVVFTFFGCLKTQNTLKNVVSEDTGERFNRFE